MTRKECLEQAMGCVLRDRNNEYGEPEQSFHYIADLWSAYLRTKIEPYDAAAMMALFKLARLRFNPYYEDGWTDLAGYAACGAELAGAEKAREDATRMWGEEYKRLNAEAEGGCCQNGNDQPEFKYGDRVQFRDEIPSTSEPHWFEGVYVERLSDGGHAVKFGPHGHVIHCSDKDIRRVPKAEGCEALVEHDAPQTKEELFNRIVDCNPATYGRAHKPTGEELAEMAEEEHE